MTERDTDERRLKIGTSNKSALGGRRVLVVEDEPFTRLDLSLAIENAGGKPMCAIDASEALSLLEKEKPDVAILDYHTGNGQNCEKIACALRRKRVPHMLYTGAEEAAELAKRLDVTVLKKPCQIEKVISNLANCLT